VAAVQVCVPGLETAKETLPKNPRIPYCLDETGGEKVRHLSFRVIPNPTDRGIKIKELPSIFILVSSVVFPYNPPFNGGRNGGCDNGEQDAGHQKRAASG
jgi:hypothetical protein